MNNDWSNMQPPFQQMHPNPGHGQQTPPYPPQYQFPPPQYQPQPPIPAPPSHLDSYPFQQIQILKNAIHVLPTNEILFDLSHPAGMLKSLFSSSSSSSSPQPKQKDVRISLPNSHPSAPPLATVRTHNLSDDVDLTLHGRATRMTPNPLTADRWEYASITAGPAAPTFAWVEDSLTGAKWTLKDGKKHGREIAELKKDTLTFRMGGLGRAMMDEVMVSAVGLREAQHRDKKQLGLVAEVLVETHLLGI